MQSRSELPDAAAMADTHPQGPKNQDSDETSSSGSSSIEEDEVSSEAEDEPELSNVVGSPLKGEAQAKVSSDLNDRLSAFLPALREANTKLESGEVDRLDNVGEHEEQYIEMNLGLGVLEQKERKDGEEVRYAESSSDEDASGDEQEEDDDDDQAQVNGQKAPDQENVLSKLMGKKTTTTNKAGAKRKIQEVD